jgi:LPS sulfotransferase NodH
MQPERQAPYRRNENLEALLQELSRLLGPVEQAIVAGYRMPAHPVVLVMGLPRCGSTLLMQWLAASGRFAYPSNLLSRFYAAPYVGARIQQLLTDPAFSFGAELSDLSSDISYSSDLGKTRGALAPNEFWYLWRRFIPNTEPRHLSEQELAQVDGRGLTAQLAALEAAFGKPLALKGLILALNIPFLDRLFERALFIHIKRHPLYNIQSLLEARERYFGARSGWYSIKPPQYAWLCNEEPITQVAGQVAFTSAAMSADLAQIAPTRRLEISYEDFCAAPAAVWQAIVEQLARQDMPVSWPYTGPVAFPTNNTIRVGAADWAAITQEYRRFAGVDFNP